MSKETTCAGGNCGDCTVCDLRAALAAANERAATAEADCSRLIAAACRHDDAMRTANERARVAEAALSLAKNDEAHAWRSVRDLREKLAAARAEGERDGLRRAAQVARAARDREDGRLAPDVIANAIEALAAAPIPVPASPPPVLGVAPLPGGRPATRFMVIRKVDIEPWEVTPFPQRAEAESFYERASEQWTETYLVGVFRGPPDVVGFAPDPSGAPPGEMGGGQRCGRRVRAFVKAEDEDVAYLGWATCALPPHSVDVPCAGPRAAAAPSPTSSATGPASTDLCECGDSAAAHADAFGQFLDCGNGFCSCKQFVRRTRTVEAAAVPPTKDAP